MKIKELLPILNKFIENGFGESEMATDETAEDQVFCLNIQGIHADDWLKMFNENPFSDPKYNIEGFNICPEIYITESK